MHVVCTPPFAAWCLWCAHAVRVLQSSLLFAAWCLWWCLWCAHAVHMLQSSLLFAAWCLWCAHAVRVLQSSLLKLRERALMEKTKTELAWLEQQKLWMRNKGADDAYPQIKKRKRALVLKLQHEQVRGRRREPRCRHGRWTDV